MLLLSREIKTMTGNRQYETDEVRFLIRSPRRETFPPLPPSIGPHSEMITVLKQKSADPYIIEGAF